MNYATLLYSKFAKSPNINVSYDVIIYKNVYYCGLNLFKNFNNYLNGDKNLNVITFNNRDDANTYFDNVAI